MRDAVDEAAKTIFLARFAEDLRSFGCEVSIGRIEARSALNIRRPPNPEDIVQIMKQIRHEQLTKAANFVRRKEEEGILSLFANGCDIALDRIEPDIRVCISRAEHEIFLYCHFFQSVPITKRVGRQIRAVVYDVGQTPSVLMGVIGLASAPYAVGCRDSFLSWKGNERRHIKDIGLRRILDLAVALPLPPYSYLFGGKLIALLALTDQFRRTARRKYGSQLLALTTTCATGLHCPIFSRILVRPGGVYRRIGETAGYTTMFVSPATLAAARVLIPGFVSASEGEFSQWSKALRVLSYALRACGVRPEPVLRLGNKKGVYFGCLSKDSMTALRTGTLPRRLDWLSVGDAASFWKRHILPKALGQPHRVLQFQGFTREEAALSRALTLDID